jgi:tetratricopeptide (TPR) repeat protein
MNSEHDHPDVLERNVTTLLETGGEPPRIADGARARIRAELVAKYGAEARGRTRMRTPVLAAAIGIAAVVALALAISRFVGGGGGAGTVSSAGGQLADGSTYVTAPGAKVTVIGVRHVRVDGAALLDVAPGKGTFVVDTARGRIEVLGTRFYVDGETARTVTAVVRGSVKLASDGGEVLLHAGEQGVAEPGHAPVRGPAPRLTQLVGWAQGARFEGGTVEPLHHGTLFARDPGIRSHPPWGEEYPLPIAKLGLDVVVEDRVARVALDQTFHNDADQDLEGVYRFAIPPDAALQRLAMYVDGKLEESAVVERMQARRIYEELVYRRIDPALLEWAGSGRLSLRVYPIPARQDKRLVLAYTQSLPKLYDDWTLTVPMPELDRPAGDFEATVRVKGCASCELSSTSHQITVEKAGEDAVVRYHRSLDKLGDSFVLHVRDARKAAIVATRSDGGDRYMMVRAPVAMEAPARTYRPRTWVILDDVSASRSAMELRAQEDLVDAFMRELDEDDRVSVVAFDVEARQKLAMTRVRDVDRKAVRTALKGEGGVGATDFDVALAAAEKQLEGVAPDDAMILYLGDGVITAGPRQLDALRAKIAGKAHFVGVGVGDGPDIQTLGALAAATGGYSATMDLSDDLAWRAFDLVAALHTARVTNLSAKLVDASGTLVPATAYLGSPQLADGEEIELVAKLAGGGTPVAVELAGTQDGAPWQRRIALTAANDSAGYLPRLWAQRHIAARLLEKHEPVALTPCAGEPCKSEGELREQRDEAIRQDVVALGKRYFLLSRHTSLLVLENDEMYARYGVTKGAGDTWAPYALPATIPVVASKPSTAPPAKIAADAELVRSPLQVFYEPPQYYTNGWNEQAQRDIGGEFQQPVTGSWGIHAIGGGGGGSLGPTRADLQLSDHESDPHDGYKDTTKLAKGEKEHNKLDDDISTPLGASQSAAPDSPTREVVTSGELAGADAFDDGATLGMLVAGKTGTGMGFGHGAGFGRRGTRWGGNAYGYGGPTLVRFTSPSDWTFDDVSGFVPAMFTDDADAWRARMQASAGDGQHTIDGASRTLLERARRALPSGVYRWGDREIALDDARHLGWRMTTEAGLGETASIDGVAFTRRYAELGLDATRAIGDDDVAVALAYLPVWIADPAHYTHWFDVAARNAHELVLSTRVRGKTKVALVLSFDDKDHLVAISDDAGAKLVEVTWGGVGPTAVRIGGESIAAGYSPEPIPNAAAWAHGATRAGVIVELPMHLASFWQARIAKLTAGTPEWRHAQRQLMVSLAATQDRNGLYAAYSLLRSNGGVELGDLAIASGGIATGSTDEQFAAALAPLAQEPLARYLVAARAYGKQPRPEKLAAQSKDGFVGALWQLRASLAELVAQHGKQAVDTLVAINDRAPELRLIGASSLARYYTVAPVDQGRAWDAVAAGAYVNIARSMAAQALWARGDYDGAADRIAQLVDKLDLHAIPAHFDQAPYMFQQSRRGAAGWQIVYASLRDRVLSGDSYEQVIALAPLAQQRGETTPILARAAELAGGDVRRRVEVARLAMAVGQGGWAEGIVTPLLKQSPSHDLYQLAAQLALAQGKTSDGLADLEAAQDAGGDERVGIATVRAELGQIVSVAGQLAKQSSGTDRERAIARAMTWGNRWRAIDSGNLMIDQALGELLLSVGDRAGAWRQLSSTIERDPWSGQGYTIVAEAFERQGKVADALPFWHQAVIIDQTNPTPRLREAQALIALGRTSEGDAILKEIAGRRWHDAWSGVVYQAKDLLARGKHSP